MTQPTNYVVINSLFRTSNSRSSTDFTYNIGSSLESDSVAIKSVSIPNVEYNISSDKVLRYRSAGVSYDLAIPAGQYDIDQLISILQADMLLNLGGTVAIVLDPVLKKLNIQASAGAQIDQASTFSKYLGFNGTGFYPLADSTNFTAPGIPQLSGSNNYYLASTVLSQGYSSILTDGQRVPIIMTIPITVEWGRIQQYETPDINLAIKDFSRVQNIQNIDIRLYNDDLEIVDLHGQEIEVIIQIS